MKEKVYVCPVCREVIEVVSTKGYGSYLSERFQTSVFFHVPISARVFRGDILVFETVVRERKDCFYSHFSAEHDENERYKKFVESGKHIRSLT